MTIKKLEYTTPELHRVQAIEAINELGVKYNSGIYKNQGAVKIGGRISAVGSLIQNKTLAATFLLRSKPARVRFHFINSAATAITGLKASLASTNSIGNGFDPSSGATSLALLTVATTVPAATINAGTDAVIPTEVISDWIAPNCLDRSDGGDGFILTLRMYQDASSAGVRMSGGGTNPTMPTEFDKYEMVTGFSVASGDFTTTQTAFSPNGGYAPPFWMEVEYETPIVTVAIVGDSIMQGRDGDPGANSAAYGAAFQALQRLSGNGKLCQLFNGGWSGAPTQGLSTLMGSVVSGYLGQFMYYVDSGLTPSIAAFCPWSVNNANPYSSDQIKSVRSSIGVFLSLCNNVGIKPVLVTPAPVNGLTSANESQRRICVEYIKSYCNTNNVPLIDRDGVYTSYSDDTGGYKLPEWCADNVHPTPLGHAVESIEWEKVLQTLL